MTSNPNISKSDAIIFFSISVPLLLTSLTISILATYLSFNSKLNIKNSHSQYFQYSSILTNVFNCGSCISVSIYFLWLTLFPLDENSFFLAHESIRLRVATTVSWFISKIFLFMIFNGRLYYAFQHSKYRSNEKVFKGLNIFVIINASLSLIIGYVGVLELGNEIVANVGFNSFHVICAILLLYLSVQFNWRMFHLSTTSIQVEYSCSRPDGHDPVPFSSLHNDPQYELQVGDVELIPNHHGTAEYKDAEESQAKLTNNQKLRPQPNSFDNDDSRSQSGQHDINHYDNDNDDECAGIIRSSHHSVPSTTSQQSGSSKRYKVYSEKTVVSNDVFLGIVTKSSLLLMFIIPFMISVTLVWSLHRFVFGVTHYSMCWALLNMSLNATVDIICITLLFKYSTPCYNALCKCTYTNCELKQFSLDYCCVKCCKSLAIRHVCKKQSRR